MKPSPESKHDTSRPKASKNPVPKSAHPPGAMAAEVSVGAAAGAAVGAIAGPAGMVAGAILGGAAGAAAAMATDGAADDAARHDGQLDEDIGVTQGSMGAPSLKHPPAKVGAYSSGSAGVASSHGTPAEGPMQDLDSDD